MTKNSRYEINHFQAKVILTKQFAKAASTLNTPEYMTLLELRRNHPDYTFELREIRKKEGKKSYRNLTYERMEEYIIAREGKDMPMSRSGSRRPSPTMASSLSAMSR